MTGALARTTAAELVKLRGLPSVLAAAAGSVAAAVVLAAAVAAAPAPSSGAPRLTAVEAVLRTIPLLQVGPLLIGVLTVATEYEGRQILTTLAAAPARLRLLAGKALAALVVLAGTGVGCVGLGLAAARFTLTTGDQVAPPPVEVGRVAGAAGYLVLIGLLGLAVAIVLRALVAPLVTVLTSVLVVSPLAAGWTEHARWLPDRAGSLLYRADADPVLTAGTGGVVLLGWIALAAVAAAITFVRRDA